MADGLRAIWRLLTQTGLINVDFADLCSVTRDRHSASPFATAEASGDKRSEQVIEKLLAHPLLDGGQVLNQSNAVLVSLAGGPDLTMNEVNKVMAQVQRRCENAHLIFGAVIDEAYSGRISVTLIASSRRAGETATVSATVGSASPAHAPSASDAAQTAAAANQFLDPLATPHPPSRCIPPPPELSEEKKEQLYNHQTGQTRRKTARMQKELPLEIVFKGRFDKSEPTIRHGKDLDLPTYIRKGVALN